MSLAECHETFHQKGEHLMRTFRDKDTANFAYGKRVARFQAIEDQALERLQFVRTAHNLQQLSVVPGYRLERLKGDRQGQYSLRINKQWRVCFEWSDEERRAVNIEIVDYH